MVVPSRFQVGSLMRTPDLLQTQVALASRAAQGRAGKFGASVIITAGLGLLWRAAPAHGCFMLASDLLAGEAQTLSSPPDPPAAAQVPPVQREELAGLRARHR